MPSIAGADQSEVESVETQIVEVEEAIEPERDAEQEGTEEKSGFWSNILPIPVLITEPAIGQGLGLAVAYFHPDKNESSAMGNTQRLQSPQGVGSVGRARDAPPTITGAFAAATTNGTKAGGMGHTQSFKNDTIRLVGVLAVADVIADFYVANQPHEFDLEGNIFYSDLRFRVNESDFFLGFETMFLDANTSFFEQLPPPLPPDGIEFGLQNSGLAFTSAYETRDNTLMPNSGQLIEFSLWRYDNNFGGDFNYWDVRIKALSFHELNDKLELDLRLEFAQVDGMPPFFGYPWVSLRGIPAMRYQNEQVASLETQIRFKATSRIQLLAFAGWGYTSGDIPAFEEQNDINTLGAGFRWKALKSQDAWIGVDYASGPEDSYWYVGVNHPW